MSRPTSVLVFGIINISLGLLGVCGIAMWIITELGLLGLPPGSYATYDSMQSNTAFQLFSRISNVVGAVATVVILSAGIGLLTLQPWARLAAIGWAIYTILMTVLGTMLSYFLILGPLIEQASGYELTALKVGVIFSVVFTCLMIAYCISMIVVLRRPAVAAAFEDADELLAAGVDGP